MTMVTDGLSVTADIIRSEEGWRQQHVWSSLQKQCWILCLFVSWCWGSVPSKLPDRALLTCAVQWQWIIEASPWAMICSKSDGKVVLVDRGANKVKEVDVVSKQVTNLAGSGHTESRDGCDLTTSFSQPTGVCSEKNSNSISVVDSSSGRLWLITSVQALFKTSQILAKFLALSVSLQSDWDKNKIKLRWDSYPCPAGLCFSQRSLIKSSRRQRFNFPDPRTRRDIMICHHPELREDDPGRWASQD